MEIAVHQLNLEALDAALMAAGYEPKEHTGSSRTVVVRGHTIAVILQPDRDIVRFEWSGRSAGEVPDVRAYTVMAAKHGRMRAWRSQETDDLGQWEVTLGRDVMLDRETGVRPAQLVSYVEWFADGLDQTLSWAPSRALLANASGTDRAPTCAGGEA